MFRSTQSAFIDALHCRNSGPPPIWLMRQAGRYLPSYQALRKRYRLVEMFHNTDLIVEVTQLPLKVMPLDAAILFADLLTLLDCIGKKWDFQEGVGPIIAEPVNPSTCLRRQPAKKVYEYLSQAIQHLKTVLTVPLIGFAGGPFTVASYLIEGKSTRDLLQTKRWMYTDPAGFHDFLKFLTEATIDYLSLQIESGVDAIQIFDSWASVLSQHDFRTFVLPYLGCILKELNHLDVPVILFCRGSCFFAEDLASLSPHAISLDWQGEMGEIRKKVPPTIALQGNLDPAILLGSQNHIRAESQRILQAMRSDSGFIFNLGHGILPATPFENVKCLVEYVHTYT